MQASDSSLLRLLDGGDKQFTIPVYQRPYSWKKGNCQQLLDDLQAIHAHDYPSHFFGTIVFVPTLTGNFSEYTIIDGQQRITTVSILLMAICNYVRANPELSPIVNADKIFESYLIDKFSNKANKAKLSLIQSDQQTFNDLLYGRDNHDTNAIATNYQFFMTYISQLSTEELKHLNNAISKLNIVNISLQPNTGDDPQLIFESLNSTGLALSETDKIRNFILMGCTKEEQNNFYENYWKPLESMIPQKTFHKFFKYFLSIKQTASPADSHIYFIFKKYYTKASLEKRAMDASHAHHDLSTINQSPNHTTNPDDHKITNQPYDSSTTQPSLVVTRHPSGNTDDGINALSTESTYNHYPAPNATNKRQLVMKELLQYANYYRAIITPEFGPKQLQDTFKRLNGIGIMTYIPLALELYRLFDAKLLSLEDFNQSLEVIESYLVRRTIGGFETNPLNKIFISIISELNKLSPESTNYYEALLYEFSRKSGKSRFPNNLDFKEKFITFELYSSSSAFKQYLLERLENFNNKEKVSVEDQLKDHSLTIEHIMPQKLTDAWKESLGKDYDEIYSKYINTIGNLTLSAYNSDYSNRTFLEKKNLEHKGFAYSKLYLNSYLHHCTKWTEEEILGRANELFQKALAIWSYPFVGTTSEKENTQTDTKEPTEGQTTEDTKPHRNVQIPRFPHNPEPTWHNWDEDMDWTGVKIKQVSLFGTIVDTKKTTNAYKLILHALYDLDPTLFAIDSATGQVNTDEVPISPNCYSTYPESIHYPYELAPGLYLEINSSSEYKRKVVIALAQRAGINSSDIKVYF